MTITTDFDTSANKNLFKGKKKKPDMMKDMKGAVQQMWKENAKGNRRGKRGS